MTKEILELQSQMHGIDSYIKMLNTPDRSDSVAFASPAHSSVKLVLCWQASAGSKNYHVSTERAFNSYLVKAICKNSKSLLSEARAMCEADLSKARISRKGELEAELLAIKELEAANR